MNVPARLTMSTPLRNGTSDPVASRDEVVADTQASHGDYEAGREPPARAGDIRLDDFFSMRFVLGLLLHQRDDAFAQPGIAASYSSQQLRGW